MTDAKNIRDYDPDRMMSIALAIYQAILSKCTDEQKVCYLPVQEVFDAMALLGGVMLSTGPAARSATKLRELTTEFGKNVAVRARQAQAEGSAKLFDVVFEEGQTFQ